MNPAAGMPNMSLSRPEKIILCGAGKLQKMVRQFFESKALEAGSKWLCLIIGYLLNLSI